MTAMFAIAIHARPRRRRTRASRGVLAHIAFPDVRRANTVGLLLLSALMIAYLALANEQATAGYELRASERRVEDLRDETRRLELATIDAQSVAQLSARVAAEEYVPVARVHFVTTSDRAVAQR